VREPGEGVLNIEIDENVITLLGDVDMDTVDDVLGSLAKLEGTVVLDVGGVTFLDSTGLQSLLRARDQARGRGDELVLRRPSPAVSRVLDVTDMWETFVVER
jgi:anti-sigma B factor antagonist